MQVEIPVKTSPKISPKGASPVPYLIKNIILSESNAKISCLENIN